MIYGRESILELGNYQTLKAYRGEIATIEMLGAANDDGEDKTE